MSQENRLTKRQTEILRYLKEYLRENDYAPSYKEIADRFKLASKATVFEHLHNLKKKGYLKVNERLPRSLSLLGVNAFAKAIEIPLAGTIAAGEPIEAIEEQETIDVPENLTGQKPCYALKVRGQSMIDDGIFDGDVVVIERNYYPQNGDVVVALLNNESATLKRYYREKNFVRLQPANKSMKPIYAKNPTIQGIAKAVIRKFGRI